MQWVSDMDDISVVKTNPKRDLEEAPEKSMFPHESPSVQIALALLFISGMSPWSRVLLNLGVIICTDE